MLKIIKIFFFIILLCLISNNSFAGEISYVIIAPAHLRPYTETIDGIKEHINKKIITYFLDKNVLFVKQRLLSKKWKIVIAIGTKSVTFVKENNIQADYYIYSLVVYPEDIQKKSQFHCGIYLIVPPKIILSTIKNKLPFVKKVIIPFSSQDAKHYALKIKKISLTFGINVKLVAVKNKDILTILKRNWKDSDIVLFVPDPIFYTKAVAKFMIEQAIIYNKGVIGYNKFFLEQGALLCFIVNFKKTGIKTAYLINQLITYQNCYSNYASFKIEINNDVYQYLYKKGIK